MPRYILAVDHNVSRGGASCLAPEGFFDGMMGRFPPQGEWARCREKVKTVTATTPNLRHYVTNILTEVNGNEAHSRCFLLMTSTTKEGGTKIMIAGEYEDRLVKIDGRWLFKERKVHMDGA